MTSRTSLLWLWLAAALLVIASSAAPHHAACPADAWRDGIPVVNCAREPACVEETWLTLERCRSLRLDASWPTYDPYIRREAGWTSFRQLLHDQARGRVLLVVGDSIGRQLFNGLACEAARDALTLQGGGEALTAWRAKVAAVDAGAWSGDVPGGDAVHVQETGTIFARHWGGLSEKEVDGYLSVADIAVVNYGLHEAGKLSYGADMEMLFAKMQRFNAQPGKLALFRETSMQAFYLSGAYVKDAEKSTTRCAPLPPETLRNNSVWEQNELVRRLGERHGVPILPFYELTVPRWNMRHEKLCQVQAMRGRADATEACRAADCLEECATDCTHLCSTPTLWAKIAHDLSAALAPKFPLADMTRR